MMALALYTVVLLIFPIACDPGDYPGTFLVKNRPITVSSNVVSIDEYTTSTNKLICSRFGVSFHLPINGQQEQVEFKYVSYLYKLVNGKEIELEVFVSNDCDETSRNLCANGDDIRLKVSSEKVMQIRNHKMEHKKGLSCDPSWQKVRKYPGPSKKRGGSSAQINPGPPQPSERSRPLPARSVDPTATSQPTRTSNVKAALNNMASKRQRVNFNPQS